MCRNKKSSKARLRDYKYAYGKLVANSKYIINFCMTAAFVMLLQTRQFFSMRKDLLWGKEVIEVVFLKYYLAVSDCRIRHYFAESCI